MPNSCYLSTAGIEGEQLNPAEVRSSVARRLQLPLESQQPRPSAKVEAWCKPCSRPRRTFRRR